MQKLSTAERPQIGWWTGDLKKVSPQSADLHSALLDVNTPFCIVKKERQLALGHKGQIVLADCHRPESFWGKNMPDNCLPVYAYAPAVDPGDLGDPQFRQTHNTKYAYIVGAMANGITSIEMVVEAGRNGFLAFFGAAGLSIKEIALAIDYIQQVGQPLAYGFNLIHSLNDPKLEMDTVKLYLQRGIQKISASAYLDLTLPLVYYRVKDIHRNPDGAIVCPNKVFAKVSRIEVARKFLMPPPEKFLTQLVERRMISRAEAVLARQIPLAEDITAEADSGGHTDNRPALTLLPTMMALRDEIAKKQNYIQTPRIGLAGGICTPASAAAAFGMGAAYVLTGSINQACVEAGTSPKVRQMLAEAQQADVTMAPSADMFELGVKVQVLKRGTMFAQRSAKLYELYCNHDHYQQIPPPQRRQLEKEIFKASFEETWNQTKRFFESSDPRQIERANKDPKHQMALVFRSYLGLSSVWAKNGDPSRVIDYQIWCGPAMGAFNQWANGSILQAVENRKTVVIALNLLVGAAYTLRLGWLRTQGLQIPAQWEAFRPVTMQKLHELLRNGHDRHLSFNLN
jgi:PfaD family protein